MRASALGATLALSALAMAPGCNLPSTASDAGVVDAGTQSWRDQCTAVYTTLCGYYVNVCGGSTPIADCVSSDMALCPCTGSGCDAPSGQAPQQVTLCQQEIEAEDCNAVVNNAVPADCAPFTSQNVL